MTDLDDIRRDGEEEIAAVMAKLDERHRYALRDKLRRFGSVKNIPPAFWRDVEEETASELVAVIYLLMINGMGYTNEEIALQGAKGARTTPSRSNGLAFIASSQAAKAAAASVDSLQRRIAYQLEQARLDQTLGNIGDLTQDGIDKALEAALDDARRKALATDQTTEAITKGQLEAAGGAGATNAAGQRVTVQMRWQTERDSKVCPRCSPLHETPEEVWSKVFYDGPGIAAHKNCRCYLRAVVVVEQPKPEDA